MAYGKFLHPHCHKLEQLVMHRNEYFIQDFQATMKLLDCQQILDGLHISQRADLLLRQGAVCDLKVRAILKITKIFSRAIFFKTEISEGSLVSLHVFSTTNCYELEMHVGRHASSLG